MRMIKKTFLILTAVAAAMAFTACKNNTSQNSKTSQAPTTAATTTAAQTTAESSSAGTSADTLPNMESSLYDGASEDNSMFGADESSGGDIIGDMLDDTETR